MHKLLLGLVVLGLFFSKESLSQESRCKLSTIVYVQWTGPYSPLTNGNPKYTDYLNYFLKQRGYEPTIIESDNLAEARAKAIELLPQAPQFLWINITQVEKRLSDCGVNSNLFKKTASGFKTLHKRSESGRKFHPFDGQRFTLKCTEVLENSLFLFPGCRG